MLKVEIKEEHVDEFVAVMKEDATQSRLEAGCLRFDLLRDNDNPNKFACYEVWSNADALKAHMDEPHTKAWGAFQYGDKKPVVSKAVFKATPVVEPQKPVDSIETDQPVFVDKDCPLLMTRPLFHQMIDRGGFTHSERA